MSYVETRTAHITYLREHLCSREWLFATGMRERELHERICDGNLVRVAHGHYMNSEIWNSLFAEDHQLLRTLSAAARSKLHGGAFSHYSAAAIWGLPLYGYRLERAHLLFSRKAHGHSSGSVLRHRAYLGSREVVEIAGLRLTNITRTIMDLARYAAPELAIGVADAGVRLMFDANRSALPPGLSEWRREQLDRLQTARGERGVAKATQIIRLSDPRADSVVESVSRLQLNRLGVDVDVQVPVAGLDGRTYWADFHFLGQDAFGEVDGLGKYLNAGMRGDLDATQVALREKQREDEIRGVTGKRIVRWQSEHITTPEKLGRRLRAFGLHMPKLP